MRILDPDENGVGEIVVSGKSVSGGYINHNDHYSDFDESGAYHTGDLGILAPDGHLYLKGRKKRMILTANGKNVYVEELEEMFLKDPRIKTAAVFEENHHPAVSIVSDLPEEDVREYLAEINRNLPRFKHQEDASNELTCYYIYQRRTLYPQISGTARQTLFPERTHAETG